MDAKPNFQSFHQHYVESDYMINYQVAYGADGYAAYRQQSANYDKWFEATFPVGGNRVLTIEELGAVVRDHIYPMIKKAADLVRKGAGSAAMSNELVDEAVLNACDLIKDMAHKNRMTTPLIEGVLTKDYWRPHIQSAMDNLDSLYRPIELIKIIDEYRDDPSIIAKEYDHDTLLRQLLNETISGFEYPDYSHRTVGSVVKKIERGLAAQAAPSNTLPTKENEYFYVIDADSEGEFLGQMVHRASNKIVAQINDEQLMIDYHVNVRSAQSVCAFLRNMGTLPKDAVVVPVPTVDDLLDEPQRTPLASAPKQQM